MKNVVLFFLVFILTNTFFAMIVKDPKIQFPEDMPQTNIHDYLPTYNPFSLYVPSSNILKLLPPDRVLDMGAAAYAQSFFQKSIYFYTNAIALFADDNRIKAFALYETGYIYYKKKQYKKALEYFDQILAIKGLTTAIESLAKSMINKIVNHKAYNLYMKQEDLLFLEEKQTQRILDKQIAKEERIAEARRRQLAKERRVRERAEKKALKQAQKTNK
ncbi:MAG: tetratricopeptide repeat protein [Brevinema sp.]